jgi:gliding motility-associated-like protein
MMNKRISLFLLMLPILNTLPAAGQNLVTNPGFELKNHCPKSRGEVAYTPYYDYFYSVIDWVSPLNTSPDYFNRCGTDSAVTVPYLAVDGYHEPHGGDAFAGISMFTGYPNADTTDYWSEYLETKLSSPMQAGHDYYVSYYVTLAYHAPQSFNIISIDKIGARLTVNMMDTFCKRPMYFLNGPADIETPAGTFITDTTNWTLVSGICHAKGGEQWLTIGSFYMQHINARLLYSPVNNIDGIHCTCYMLVDDVCVTDMEHPVTSDTIVYTPQFPIVLGARIPEAQYAWNSGDTSAQMVVQAAGDYERQRWNNCNYYVERFHVEEMAPQSCLWLPTAFTPNGDGENDLFGPGNVNCEPLLLSFSFSIFNRWGQMVFQTNTPGEKWNGTFHGVPQEMGVYPYVLKYSFSGKASPTAASPMMIKGDVSLIR